MRDLNGRVSLAKFIDIGRCHSPDRPIDVPL